MGNYDEDYDDERSEYDRDEDLDMMFDEEDLNELYGEWEMRKTLSEEELSLILKKSILIRGALIMRDSRNPDPINKLEQKLRRVIIDKSDEYFDGKEAEIAMELIDQGVRSQILNALQVVQDPERDRNEEYGREMIQVVKGHTVF